MRELMGVWMNVVQRTSTDCMGASYVVGDAVAPLMTLSLLVVGQLASVRAEAASLLQLCGW